jgi:predicted TIM-barrel fold metal-dependent hydrolase
MARRWPAWLSALAAGLILASPAGAADYTGPLIDAHSHVPNAVAIDVYVEAMKRHNVSKVVLLGVGGLQKDDATWLAAAARKYPDRVIAAVPLPDPTSDRAPQQLEAALTRSRARVIGEVHVRQIGRTLKIDRSPDAPTFLKVLEVAARHTVPIVIHDELDDGAARRLEEALRAQPRATVILAHAGQAAPARVEGLLARNPNLLVDLSGMHFQRNPALATEHGPLDPAWKALIERMPERFLMGIDVWSPRLFEPVMLDRLMSWTRRILGELKPEIATRVAATNAVRVFRIEETQR